MEDLVQIESADRQLLAGIAMAMAEAERRSRDWVVCKPGCTQCCHGPFPITELDAMRLQAGLANSPKADLIRARAAAYVELLPKPLDLDELPDSLDEIACPALDPATGTCDLYDSRPVTCRVFGPATRVEDDAVAACELCYEGATEVEIDACAVHVDADGVEALILQELPGTTLVAFALMS